MLRRLLPFAFALAAACTGAANAQDYSAGKTPAQLFASDCSACHKSPQGLAKGSDTRSLANFLREHYTTKPESAGALAAFVAGAGGGSAEGKPKPGSAREKPEPAAASAKPRRPEQAGEAEQGQRPAPRPRAAVAGSEPKPGEEQRPAVRRQPVAGEGGRPVTTRHARPGEGARPETDQGPRPSATAEPKPRGRAPTPANAARREPEKPAAAQPAAVEDKLKSYISSGEEAKEAKAAEPAPSTEADRKLQGYATSGGSVTAIAGSPPKAAASADAATAAKPESEPGAEQPKPAAPVAGGERNRPRRAAAPVENDPSPDPQ